MKEPKLDRNLNPHKAAVVAMSLYGQEYARQDGGAIDFWEALSGSQRARCRELVSRLEAAPPEVLRHLKLRGAMASYGFDTLTPSDVLAFQVLLASGHLRSDGTSALEETNP